MLADGVQLKVSIFTLMSTLDGGRDSLTKHIPD